MKLVDKELGTMRNVESITSDHNDSLQAIQGRLDEERDEISKS